VTSVLEADAVVVLGRIALHTADQRQTLLTAAIARVMLRCGIPGVERHAAWLLALQAHAGGDPVQARRWLTARGSQQRLALFPLFPLDPADDPQLVRLALASEDRELAESATALPDPRSSAARGEQHIRHNRLFLRVGVLMRGPAAYRRTGSRR
jgi:hypothetical protein